MIQRSQTLWLLLAAVAGGLSYKVPFFESTNNSTDGTSGTAVYLNAGSNFYLLLATGLTVFLALVTIFYYKNRKLQLKLALGGMVLSLVTMILFFSAMKKLGGSVPSITSVTVLAMPVFFALAGRGIWKDEKLVKSLDRLR